MNREKEFEHALRLLSKLSAKEKRLLEDEFRRLTFLRKYERRIDNLISFFTRDIARLENNYMTTKSSSDMDRFKKDLDEHKELLNEMIDETVKEMKAVYRNVLSASEIEDVQHLIDKEHAQLKKDKMIELHDFEGMRKILTQVIDNHPDRDPSLEKEHIFIVGMMQNIRRRLKKSAQIDDLDHAVKDVLDKFKKFADEQAVLLRSQISLLQSLKLKKDDLVLDGSKIMIKYGRAIGALKENIGQFRNSLLDEKREVFDVLNLFMKKKRDMESILEHLINTTDRENDLGQNEVSVLLSTAYSVKEAFELSLLLFDYKELFSRNAQKIISEDMKHYRRLMADTEGEAMLAYIDARTGLQNQRAFIDRVREMKRFQSRTVSMIALDIDNFKAVNECFGHRGGDIVLEKVAKYMNQQLRKGTDILYRVGGEEFVIILLDCPLQNAIQVAEKVRVAVEQMDIPVMPVDNEKHWTEYWNEGKIKVIESNKIFTYEDGKTLVRKRKEPSIIKKKTAGPDEHAHSIKGQKRQIWLTISFGVANYPDNTRNIDALKDIADSAAVEAKTLGRNQVVTSHEKAA